MSINVDGVVKEMMRAPVVQKELARVARDYEAAVRRLWAGHAPDTNPWHYSGDVFEIVPSNNSGRRPWFHVHVNHPAAVAMQAKYGIFTKAAEAVGYPMRVMV